MSDLTAAEQANVRTALRFLRARTGGLAPIARALHVSGTTAKGRAPTASLAVRVARLAGVGVDDVLRGSYPPADVCPHCGHRKEVAAAE